jgi:hypothetical protein
MRLRSLVLIFAVAGCGDSNTNNNNNDDLSMTADDLSMSGGPDGGQDAGLPDLSPLTPSGMIQAVRNAADGVMGNAPDGGQPIMAMPVEDVYVTYLKPNVPNQTFDSAGFFVQAEPNGPALFVNVDTTTLTPAPKVGDLISFTVNAVSKNATARQATAISGLAVTSSNNPLDSFVQDLSAKTDVVTALDSYESELSKFSALTVTGGFFPASGGYVAATVTSGGITTTNNNFKLRLPTGVRDAKDVTLGCVIAVGNTPMWRFNAVAEPQAFQASEVTVTSCPAPQVVSAHATDATHVVVTFDRFLDPASVTTGAFTFDNALTASGVNVNAANQVTVTTSAQTAGLAYTVTVASTVKDQVNGVDPAHNSSKFHGFSAPATLLINEFTPGITGGFDLLELKAVTGGSVQGFTLQQDLVVGAKTLATLPDQVVAANELIVLHIQPSPSPAPTNEFALITECTAPSCYATAWDANGTADIGNSARVIVIKDALGQIQDGVPFFNKTADADAAFLTEMTALKNAGQWTCAAAACVAADATRSNGAGNSAAGKSIKRTGVSDTNNVADWPTTGNTNSTYGLP